MDGEVPSPANPPSGCAFQTRCPLAMDICKQQRPVLQGIGTGRSVACHLHNKKSETKKEKVAQ
ncbi:oligopeptide/dipeptide ABC transporter ATP-binding protein [Lentibacillus sp. L22]|uniref:oligopeptide/dipeptide ABC transporter ATP-binding protein n=1 Tax=Lentibacillus TaxID=175304 RepID=UPI00346560CD